MFQTWLKSYEYSPFITDVSPQSIKEGINYTELLNLKENELVTDKVYFDNRNTADVLSYVTLIWRNIRGATRSFTSRFTDCDELERTALLFKPTSYSRPPHNSAFGLAPMKLISSLPWL